MHPLEIALDYAGLGQREQAVAWVLKEYSEREGVVQDIAIDPRLRTISVDPRFQDILHRSGLAYNARPANH